MTGERFALEVKGKLNRLDSSAYEDVREEEIWFFALDALKTLSLQFDDEYDRGMHKDNILLQAYLQSIIITAAELPLTDNKGVFPSAKVFKIKDLQVYVEVTGTTEKGWQPTRTSTTLDQTLSTYNPFTKSYPDMPVYRLLNDGIEFEVDSSFTCTKIKYDYLKYPEVITGSTNLDMHFVRELQDKTVTLILENIESRRIQSQPVVSRS